MPSNTPQFDQAIATILNQLHPHKRTCEQCGAVFEVLAQDIEFYKKLKVPPPTLCPKCRMQRRLGWRINFLPILYKKTCSAPGHTEKVITMYSEQNPVKVYDDDYYLSDEWDALQFGRDYDLEKPFFDQFQGLTLDVPHQTLQKDPKSVNSDYVISGVSSKNCYYVCTPVTSENVYYSRLPLDSKDCIDTLRVKFSEQCYESINLDHCYNCNFCYDSSNCLDSYFLYDCRNCQDCFGCTNLRNKKYYFFNKPFSKEEYQEKMKEIDLGKRSVVKKYRARFEKVLRGAIRKNLYNIKTQNCLGNDLENCRDCFHCFEMFNSENIRYSFGIDKRGQDSMDHSGGAWVSLCYETTGIAHSNKVKFSFLIRNGLDLEYCSECSNCQHCFGCFGLKNKKFCIFNKQYKENDYWQLVDKIKTEMLKRGEYGEFFPLKFSPFPYQDSNAQIEFPLQKKEIIKNGWHWQEEVKSDLDLSKFEVLQPDQVPDDIADVSEDILKKVIIGKQTKKPFRIKPYELDFYKKKGLPLPVVHPLQRIKNRYSYGSFWHHYKLYQDTCSNCGKQILSGYDPKKNFKVYCKECYQQEVL